MGVTNYICMDREIIGEETGGVRLDYLTDALGSVTATLDQAGTIQNTYRYKPYGGLLERTGTAADPAFTWVGSEGYRQTGEKYADAFVRARHYGSSQAQWLSIDEFWPQQRAYAYVNGMPVTAIDPSGRACTLTLSANPYSRGGASCTSTCCGARELHNQKCSIWWWWDADVNFQFNNCSGCNYYQWYQSPPGNDKGPWIKDKGNNPNAPWPEYAPFPSGSGSGTSPDDPEWIHEFAYCDSNTYDLRLRACLCCSDGASCIEYGILGRDSNCENAKCTGKPSKSLSRSVSNFMCSTINTGQ